MTAPPKPPAAPSASPDCALAAAAWLPPAAAVRAAAVNDAGLVPSGFAVAMLPAPLVRLSRRWLTSLKVCVAAIVRIWPRWSPVTVASRSSIRHEESVMR